jgi:hypothetical protein
MAGYMAHEHRTRDHPFSQRSILGWKALADPTRQAVLGRLGEGPASIGLGEAIPHGLAVFREHIRCSTTAD